MQSFTQQIFNNITRFIPAFTDEFSYKYALTDLTYDYTSRLATASMSAPDIAQLVATGFTKFTITNVTTKVNILSADWMVDLSLKLTFDKNVSFKPKTCITLSGFLPNDYNTLWQVESCTYKECILSPYNNVSIATTRPAITQLGYYANLKPVSGFNGIHTITIDQSNNTISYPINPQSITNNNILTSGYIHNWHNNILIGRDTNFYQQGINTDKNFINVVANDWTSRTNQEKFTNIDSSDRQDSRLGNMTRVLYNFYIDYIIHTTNSPMQSTIEGMATDFWLKLYTFDGLRFTVQNPLNPEKQFFYYYALSGEYAPLRNDDGVLQQIIRYNITTMVLYAGSYLLNDDFFDTFTINEANFNSIIQNNNFTINLDN